MKKFASVLFGVFVAFSAFADNTPTSKGYVDNQVSTLQDTVPAIDNNTVLTRTNIDGKIGEKAIYDSSENYATQTNALVTAEDANAAIQIAIDTEFVCIEWLDGAEHTNDNCLIYDIRAVSPQKILPNGYTALEYIESTGKQYIDTGIQNTSKLNIQMEFTRLNSNYNLIYGSQSGGYLQNAKRRNFLVLPTDNSLLLSTGSASSNSNVTSDDHIISLNTKYTITAYFSNDSKIILNDNIYLSDTAGDNAETGLTDFLFCYNYSDRHNVSAPQYIINAKVYSAQIFNSSDVLARNFIPARRNSDNVVGMYDTVSNTFFTNAGTGAFIAGPELNVFLPSAH